LLHPLARGLLRDRRALCGHARTTGRNRDLRQRRDADGEQRHRNRCLDDRETALTTPRHAGFRKQSASRNHRGPEIAIFLNKQHDTDTADRD
jgi:hypothetical protein